MIGNTRKHENPTAVAERSRTAPMIASLLHECLALPGCRNPTELKRRLNDDRMNLNAGAIAWNYDRVEVITDLIVHIIGVSFGAVASVMLVAFAAKCAAAPDLAAVTAYAVGLLSMLVISAAYNLWPASPTKWLLRRFDHSAIYLLIAATYTPFAISSEAVPARSSAPDCSMVRRCRGDCSQDHAPRSLRPGLHCRLPSHGLERCGPLG